MKWDRGTFLLLTTMKCDRDSFILLTTNNIVFYYTADGDI